MKRRNATLNFTYLQCYHWIIHEFKVWGQYGCNRSRSVVLPTFH